MTMYVSLLLSKEDGLELLSCWYIPPLVQKTTLLGNSLLSQEKIAITEQWVNSSAFRQKTMLQTVISRKRKEKW